MTYARQIATARRLIAKYGMEVSWGVLQPASGTPWRPQPTAEPIFTPVRMAFLPVGRVQLESYAARGIEVTVGASLGYMASTPGVNPVPADFVRRDGEDYAVDYIDTIAPSGIAILYIMLLRAPVRTVVSNG